jgi:hypothetical protein
MDSTARPVGRPRIHISNADRQRAFRQRRKQLKLILAGELPPSPDCLDLEVWNTYLGKIGLGAYAGLDDQCGKKLITGGYDMEKIGYVYAAHERAESGRRVKPRGAGPDGMHGWEFWID